MTSRPLRVGFISFANGHQWSYAWGAKAVPGVELVGAADSDEGRRQQIKARLGLPVYSRNRDLLREGLDAVFVCSENAYHGRDVIEAAAARVHVLCEKPLATTAADARAMIAACARAGVHLGTAFPCRYATPIRRAYDRVSAGAIGRVLGANTTNHGSMPGGWFAVPKLSGGGAMTDHTVHVADLLRWFLHDEVAEVYAESGRLIYPTLKCDDCGVLSLRFRKGTIATLDASWSRVKGFPTWGDVTLKLWGERGTIAVDAFAQHVTVWGEHPWEAGWGDNMDAGLVADFLSAVRDNRPPTITGTDGLRAVEVTLAAYRSARTHKPVRIGSSRDLTAILPSPTD